MIKRIKGALQRYAWGGQVFIPELIGTANEDNQPFAELWMGMHHRGLAYLTDKGQDVSLADFIATDSNVLGTPITKKFGKQLPFLFKVLDVNQMLSIQSHPTKERAIEGFKRENELGIPLTAKHRVYRDDNHKPEVMVALTDFWLLHGFKSIAGIKEVLANIPEFASLKAYFKDNNIKELYRYIMQMPQEQINVMLEPMYERLVPAYHTGALVKNQAEYWAAKAFVDNTQEGGNYDRGIFSIFLSNLVQLKEGEAIFQGAGIPHAYLEGVNMELMANSDNVFRGGLTVKHIDVPELLANVDFSPVIPNVLLGEQISDTERVFKTPAPDFELSRIDVTSAQPHKEEKVKAFQIVIIMEGSIKSDSGESFKRGDIFIAPAGAAYAIYGNATLFKASVPV